MMWGYYDGGNWLWMSGTMVLFLAGLTALVFWGVRSVTGRRSNGDQATETLRRRLAAGEISQEDFDKTKRALQG